MKTLIIPDLHNRIDWIEPYLATKKFDKVIFLGDYFDDFDDTPEIAAKTARWLKKYIYREDFVFLMGNHDLAYRFPHNPHCHCDGFTEEKSKIISSIISEKDWFRFVYLFTDQGWFFSHAGFDHRVIPTEFISADYLLEEIRVANLAGAIGVCSAFLIGDEESANGILWQRWEKLQPTRGISQIVGHTPHKKVRLYQKPKKGKSKKTVLKEGQKLFWKSKFISQVVCLDTDSHHVGILENCTLTIEKVNPSYLPTV